MRVSKLIFILFVAFWLPSGAWADTAEDARGILSRGGDAVVESLGELGAVSPASAAAVIEQVARQQPRMLPETLQAISVRMDDPEAFAQALADAEARLADEPALQAALRAAGANTRTVSANREDCPGRSCDNNERRGESPDPRGPPGNGPQNPPSSEPFLEVALDAALLGTEAGVSTEVECLEIGCDIEIGLDVEPAPPLDSPASPM